MQSLKKIHAWAQMQVPLYMTLQVLSWNQIQHDNTFCIYSM